MTTANNLEFKVQATMRKFNSGTEPAILLKGKGPVIIIEFPKPDDRDVIDVRVDSTGFEPIELYAMLRTISDSIKEGIVRGGVVETKTRPEDFDWSDLTSTEVNVADMSADDLGENDPDGGGK